MKKYVVWDEPYTVDPTTSVTCKMSFEDVVVAQRVTYKDKVKHLTDEQVFEDFAVVHWGKIVEEER